MKRFKSYDPGEKTGENFCKTKASEKHFGRLGCRICRVSQVNRFMNRSDALNRQGTFGTVIWSFFLIWKF